MASTFPKIAAVLLSMCSIAFMGMSISAYYGRPDPLAESAAPELKNYKFEAPLSGTGTWSYTYAVGQNQNSTTHPTAYAAIADAYEKEASRLSSLTNEMNDLASQLTTATERFEAATAQDVAALEEREEVLTTAVTEFHKQRQAASERLQSIITDTTTIRSETARRREDVQRLQNELEELRTDRFRLEELRRVLTDRLLRLQLENFALDKRLEQIQGQP